MAKKKPKKGGMVLIIGMGGKSKDMKKAEKRSYGRGSKDAQAASRNKTHARMKSGRIDIDELLGKRSIDPDNFHGEMQRRHGMDMEEYLAHENAPFDIQPLIDELAEKSANERGRAKSTRADKRAQNLRTGLTNPKIKGMLRARGIDPKEWENAVRRLDDSQLNDNTFDNLLRKLTPEMSDKDRNRVSNEADRIFQQQGGYDSLFDEVGESRAGEIETDKNQRSVHDMPLSESDPSGDSDEEEKLQRLLHLFEARGSTDPMEDAMRALHAMGGQEGGQESDRNRKDSLFGEASTVNTLPYAGSGKRVQDSRASGKGRNPAGPAPPGSVEAEYYGFRGASPIQGSGREEPEEEDMDMDAVEENMFRTSFDNPNVMSAAWALLKGNPATMDAHGQNIDHPAAMVYDNLAMGIESRDDPRHHSEDGKPSKGMQELLRRPHVLDEYRRMARDDTHAQMQHRDSSAGANHGIERMPRPEAKRSPQEDEMHNLSQEIGQLAQTREEEHGLKLPSYDE